MPSPRSSPIRRTRARRRRASTHPTRPTLQLPVPVPARLVRLAASLVKGASDPYDKALELENYLTSSRFHYQLPARTRLGRGQSAPLDTMRSRTSFSTPVPATASSSPPPSRCLPGSTGSPPASPSGSCRGRLVGHDEWTGRGERHPRLAPGAVLGLRLDRLRAHARDHDRRLVGSEQLRVDPAHGVDARSRRRHLWAEHRPPSRGGGTTNPSGRPLRPVATARCRPVLALWLLSLPLAALRVGRRRLVVEALAPAAPEARAACGRARRLGRGLADPRRRRAWRAAAPRPISSSRERVVSAGVLSAEAELALCDLARLATSAWYGRSSPERGECLPGDSRRPGCREERRRGLARWRRARGCARPEEHPGLSSDRSQAETPGS